MSKFLFVSLILAPTLISSAYAAQGDWLVRTRAVLVAPTEKSSGVLPLFPNSSISVDNAFTGEVDVSYFILPQLAVETAFGYPTRHHLSGEGDLAFLGEVVSTDALASIWTLQFHPFPDAKFRPYVGVGANWTRFVNERESNSLLTAFGPTTVSIDQSYGIVIQAGADIALTDRIFMNFDAKYMDVDTTGKVKSIGIVNSVDLALDPLVFGIGFGARF